MPADYRKIPVSGIALQSADQICLVAVLIVFDPALTRDRPERKTANPLGLAVSLYLLVVMGRIELPTYGL